MSSDNSQQNLETTLIQRIAGPSTNKAGLVALNQGEISNRIFEISKVCSVKLLNQGSKFFDNEVKRNKVVQNRIAELLKRKSSLSSATLRKNEAEANKIFDTLESSRDLSRTIVHIDMDGKKAN